MRTARGLQRPEPWIFLVALAVLLPAVLYGKLHDDEAIYYEIARNIAKGLGPLSYANPNSPGVFSFHVPIPSYLSAPALWVWDDIRATRLVAAVFSAAGATALFRVTRRLSGWRAAAIGFMLIVGSLHFLRFGGRFYYDPFGFAFFWIAVDAYLSGRHGLTGLFLGAAVVSRELWLLPAVMLAAGSLWRTRRFHVVWGGMVSVAGLLLWAATNGGLVHFLEWNAFFRSSREMAQGSTGSNGVLFSSMVRGWVQTGLASGLALVGALFVPRAVRKAVPLELWLSLLAAMATLTAVPGFVRNGGFTQYALLVLGFFILLGGAGWDSLGSRLARHVGNARVLASAFALVLVQLLVGNYLISRGAVYGSTGVYGLGFNYDQEVIRLLKQRAQGGWISGVHGVFVQNARWFWVERDIAQAATYRPDWVVVYSLWVDVDSRAGEIWVIGPYTVIHLKDPGRFTDFIKVQPVVLPDLQKPVMPAFDLL